MSLFLFNYAIGLKRPETATRPFTDLKEVPGAFFYPSHGEEGPGGLNQKPGRCDC